MTASCPKRSNTYPLVYDEATNPTPKPNVSHGILVMVANVGNRVDVNAINKPLCEHPHVNITVYNVTMAGRSDTSTNLKKRNDEFAKKKFN